MIKDGTRPDERLESGALLNVVSRFNDLCNDHSTFSLVNLHSTSGEMSPDSSQLHLFLLSTSHIFFPVSLPHCSSLLLPATSLPFIAIHPKDISTKARQVSLAAQLRKLTLRQHVGNQHVEIISLLTRSRDPL
jgi:hypothetical protein